jgi:hypothetical protein
MSHKLEGVLVGEPQKSEPKPKATQKLVDNCRAIPRIMGNMNMVSPESVCTPEFLGDSLISRNFNRQRVWHKILSP